MIVAPPTYRELLAQVSEVLGPDRMPALVGIDGRDGEGKTSAATWLAWQLGMPAIHLDLFVERTKDEGPLRWRTDDLANCVKTRRAKPILIEGVLLWTPCQQSKGRSIFWCLYKNWNRSAVETEAGTMI